MELSFAQQVRLFADRALAAAKEAGIDPAEVRMTSSESFSVRVRAGKLEDYKVSDRFSLTLRGKTGGRIGTAGTQALAMVWPSLPASRDIPFCALSAENTPQNVESRSAMALLRMTTG